MPYAKSIRHYVLKKIDFRPAFDLDENGPRVKRTKCLYYWTHPNLSAAYEECLTWETNGERAKTIIDYCAEIGAILSFLCFGYIFIVVRLYHLKI